MDAATDLYRTSLANELAYTATATATTAVFEISGPSGQYRLEVARFAALADAVAGRDTLNASNTHLRRRYKTGPSAGLSVPYRTACANESTEGDGTAAYALARYYGSDGLGREVVARFDTLAHAQAALNTLSLATPGDRRYEVITL